MKKLIIATRGSQLALWQSNHIKAVLEEQNPGMEVELNVIVTTGDKIIDR
ncbi:MAG: hydroxymethylbilane synthase, partial [Sulfurimonas sp.]|nr:hydroxymethylbilane synthase [Sulfurimonas sp.]